LSVRLRDTAARRECKLVREADESVGRGLIDCHVHVTAVPGVKTMLEMVKLPEQAVNLRSVYVLKG